MKETKLTTTLRATKGTLWENIIKDILKIWDHL